jgi:hypothetical protein
MTSRQVALRQCLTSLFRLPPLFAMRRSSTSARRDAAPPRSNPFGDMQSLSNDLPPPPAYTSEATSSNRFVVGQMSFASDDSDGQVLCTVSLSSAPKHWKIKRKFPQSRATARAAVLHASRPVQQAFRPTHAAHPYQPSTAGTPSKVQHAGEPAGGSTALRHDAAH